MTTPAKKKAEASICQEHREFAPLIAAIEKVEGSVGEASPLLLRADSRALQESLAHGLIPHAVGEGRTMFPVLRRVTGSDEAARSMNREHKEIARLTDQLERLTNELVRSGRVGEHERSLRGLLSQLRLAVDEHFSEEEEACFSVLQAELSEDEARDLFVALERATDEVRNLYE